MQKIHTILKSSFEPQKWESNYLFNEYELVNKFLATKFPKEFDSVLAKPTESGGKINFYTSKTGIFKPLSELSASESRAIKLKYNVLLHNCATICADLIASNDKQSKQWAALVKRVFEKNAHTLFSDGEDFVIIWGWVFNEEKTNILPEDQFIHLTLGYTPVSDEAELIAETDTEAKTETETKTDTERNTSTTGGETNVGGTNNNPNDEELTERRPIVKRRKNVPLFYQLLNWFERFWWLFLILVGLLIWWMYLNGCRCHQNSTNIDSYSREEIHEKYVGIVPDTPRRRTIPIEEDDIITDPDYGFEIVGNLVNLAMKELSGDFKKFIVELKEAYPGEEYEIVYYDEETTRVQLKVPESERIAIKDDIKEKMSNYDLLVWDEAIFNGGKLLNDPALTDNSKNWHFKAIGVEQAWDITTGDTSVVIAIIDDAFDLNHDELRGKFVKPYNVISHDENVVPSGEHGTHVAGLAVANGDNGKGIAGIAPDCLLMPIQASMGDGRFAMTDVVDGILYAMKNGADVINLSLGVPFSELEGMPIEEQKAIAEEFGLDQENFWDELFEMAVDRNTTIVLAAGNEHVFSSLDPMRRSEKALKVMATNQDKEITEFSNFYPDWSSSKSFISSPGKDIYSSVPGNSYEIFDGTSMAAPIVTGAIGLMLAVNPSLSSTDVLEILRKTASSVDSETPPQINVEKAIKLVKSEN